MTSERKVILILVDGLSADYFAANRRRLPYLDAMAKRGLQVERLTSVVPATSLPGRASMLTGRRGAEHGIYGNQILDQGRFRGAEAEDLAAPSIARQASLAGLRVANVGFGLVAEADTETFVTPWWSHDLLNGRPNVKLPLGTSFGELLVTKDPTGAVRAVVGDEDLSSSADILEGILHPQMIGMAADHKMMEIAADLAAGDQPPDLILTEIAITDVLLHYHGFSSGAARWGIAMADMMVGHLLHRLEAAGRNEDYLVVVASDHGHAPITTALYPDVLLPDGLWAMEGASLHVVHDGRPERADIERRLAAFDIRPADGDHLPDALRERLITFTAPPQHGFEARPADASRDIPTGAPTIVSTHGLRPGAVEDDRICILAGAGVESGSVQRADAEQLAPTLAAALGLDLSPYSGAPLF